MLNVRQNIKPKSKKKQLEGWNPNLMSLFQWTDQDFIITRIRMAKLFPYQALNLPNQRSVFQWTVQVFGITRIRMAKLFPAQAIPLKYQQRPQPLNQQQNLRSFQWTVQVFGITRIRMAKLFPAQAIPLKFHHCLQRSQPQKKKSIREIVWAAWKEFGHCPNTALRISRVIVLSGWELTKEVVWAAWKRFGHCPHTVIRLSVQNVPGNKLPLTGFCL